jgi:hypothetical protein
MLVVLESVYSNILVLIPCILLYVHGRPTNGASNSVGTCQLPEDSIDDAETCR